MSVAFYLTTQAIDDLDDIWRFISQYSTDAADKVETEIIATCHRLAEYPLLGHRRQDITPLRVRFWTLPKYPNVIVYRPVKPLQVILRKIFCKIACRRKNHDSVTR
jgi:plasmid stabilization system protein ParE